MIAYSILLLVFLLLAPRYRVETGQHGTLRTYSPIVWAAIFISVIVGFRDGGGVDYSSYVRMFDAIGQNLYTTIKLENGYYLLNVAVKELGGGPEWVFFISLLISVLPVAAILNRYSPYPALGVLIFFGSQLLFMLLNLVRQGIAVGICFYSIRFITERRPWAFLATVAIAAQFHISAFLFLPAYLLAHQKVGRPVLVVLLGVSMAMMIDNSIILALMHWLNDVLFDGRYGHLLQEVLDVKRELGRRLIVYNAVAAFLIWNYNKLCTSQAATVFTNIAIWGFLLLNATNGLPALPRTTHYFTFASFIAIPHAVSMFASSAQRSLAYAATLGIYGILFVHAIVTDGYDVLPFEHLWL